MRVFSVIAWVPQKYLPFLAPEDVLNTVDFQFPFYFQEEVRPQDTVSVIGGVAGGSKHGRKAAWKFIKDNWEELYNRYQGGFLISRLIKVCEDFYFEYLVHHRCYLRTSMIHQVYRQWSLLFKSFLKNKKEKKKRKFL